jgi:hypothetical protein
LYYLTNHYERYQGERHFIHVQREESKNHRIQICNRQQGLSKNRTRRRNWNNDVERWKRSTEYG